MSGLGCLCSRACNCIQSIDKASYTSNYVYFVSGLLPFAAGGIGPAQMNNLEGNIHDLKIFLNKWQPTGHLETHLVKSLSPGILCFSSLFLCPSFEKIQQTLFFLAAYEIPHF